MAVLYDLSSFLSTSPVLESLPFVQGLQLFKSRKGNIIFNLRGSVQGGKTIDDTNSFICLP